MKSLKLLSYFSLFFFCHVVSLNLFYCAHYYFVYNVEYVIVNMDHQYSTLSNKLVTIFNVRFLRTV